MKSFNSAVEYMRTNDISAWLLWDFRTSNPIMWEVLEISVPTTRRCALLIDQSGRTRILAHRVDRELFAGLPCDINTYTSWVELELWLSTNLKGGTKVAMEYSALAAIPTMSWVDAGTFELVQRCGVVVVSSADLYQLTSAIWSTEALASHLRACKVVDEIKDGAFQYIAERHRNAQAVNEYDVQQFILNEFEKNGLETEDVPVVAVNSHSGDPHYEPSLGSHAPIIRGDWVLIDLWARTPGVQNVFADITWVGYVGSDVPKRFVQVFEAVRAARDGVVAKLEEHFANGRPLHGWELDAVARLSLSTSGFGKGIVHRTGHSIGPGKALHALGVNLDDLETHDTRRILPGVGFSVEPGIYLPEFGVRLEINVYVEMDNRPRVTTRSQTEIVRVQ
jgi:Xaa-Pro dipeptidase